MKFWKKARGGGVQATQLRTDQGLRFGGLSSQIPLGGSQERLYRGIRESVPILDAAVGKLIRLVGGFTIECTAPGAQKAMEEFLRKVPVGRGQVGLDGFLGGYLDSMLTYGRALGELVTGPEGVQAVLWGDVTQAEIRQGESPLDITICGPNEFGQMMPLPRQELLLFSTLNPEVGSPYGVSLFRSMPFLTEILMKIYETVGRNWERAGNVRYSVVYRPGEENVDQGTVEHRLSTMAREWSQAMEESKSGAVRDFVAVGDVEIKVIGADGPVLDSEVPVRQILEQLVAKTGLPPFLLGLSWASTERMSQQQADMLTSELWAIRRAVTPVLEKIGETFLRLQGWDCGYEVVWEDISLQDMVEEAKTALYRVQAENLQKEEANEDQ